MRLFCYSDLVSPYAPISIVSVHVKISIDYTDLLTCDEKCHFNHCGEIDAFPNRISIRLAFVARACMWDRTLRHIPTDASIWIDNKQTRMTINFAIVILWDIQFSHEKRTTHSIGPMQCYVICNRAVSRYISIFCFYLFSCNIYQLHNTKTKWLVTSLFDCCNANHCSFTNA